MAEPEDPDHRLDAAAHVADGEPVDWSAAAEGARTEEERQFFRKLRAIADIARAQTPPVSADGVHESIRGPQASTSDQPVEPLAWGPLRIIEKIGRGSFGDVYRARDPRLDRDVALKLLRHRSNEAQETEIIEEARLMARVRHPNVVTIYGADRVQGRSGIWMELLVSPTLAEEVGHRGPLAVKSAVETAAEVAGALAAIHAAGLLHRDVKPQNVLRNERGAAVLTDFGTGIEIEDPASPAAGTPLYIAPEVLRGELPSVRGDIYSLGVLLYYLLSGRHPVEGRSLDEIREAHRIGRRTPLRSRVLEQRFPRRLTATVERAIDNDPGKRFASAAEFEHALRSGFDSRSHRRTAAAAIATLLVVSVGVVAWRLSVRDHAGARALVRVGLTIPPGGRFGGLAPDGTAVICTSPQIRFGLCPLASGAATPLPFDPAAGAPDGAFSLFSPDGRQIVYMRRQQQTGPSPMTLHIMNIDGSGDRRLFTPTGNQLFLRPGGWATTSNSIAADLRDIDGAHRLVLVDPGTGSIRVIREFDREHPVETFDISGDGRFVVHDHQAGTDGRRDLIAIDTASGESWILVGGESDEIAPLWSPDGSRLFFSSDRAGTMGLWMQRVAHGRPRGEPEMIMDTGRDLYLPVGATNDGVRILYQRRTGGFDGYRTILEPSGATMPVRRLSSRALDQIAAPDWSSDGSRLAYLASTVRLGHRPGTTRVVIQDVASGRELEWPIRGQVHQVSLRWWPDGHSLLLRRPGDGVGTTVVEQRDAETGRVLREWPVPAGGDVVPTPDGAAILYTTAGAVRELRLADLRDRTLLEIEKPWTLVQTAGLILSADGDRVTVALMQRDPDVFAARAVSRRENTTRDVRFPVSAFPVWWIDSDRLLATTWDPSTRRGQLFVFDPSTGGKRDLGLVTDNGRQFRLHPDGRQILYSAGQTRLEYWWLQNPDRD